MVHSYVLDRGHANIREHLASTQSHEAPRSVQALDHCNLYLGRLVRESGAEEVTRARVRDYCFPDLFREPGGYNFTQGFGSANLLGAIWMGMFWILWDDQTRMCRNPECNHIIPYTPTPERRGSEKNDRREGYATRKDKVYCSPRCEKRHYYLRYTKPAREAAKAKASR